MKILWVVGFVVPQAKSMINNQKHAFGGWVGAMIDQLAQVNEIELGVAMRSPIKTRDVERIGDVMYYVLPHCGENNHDIPIADCRFTLKDFDPDILHVEGTECAHAHTFLSCWSGANVVELQGIVNGHNQYYQGGLLLKAMLWSGNPLKMLTALALIIRKKKNLTKKRLRKEIEAISLAKNIIGRTTWDRAYSYSFNTETTYYHCNHTLRDEFYSSSWSIERMQRHSLFIGNAQVPLKGAHYAMCAVAKLMHEYPEIKLYIAGEDPYPSSWKQFRKWSGYAAYLRRLVKELGICNHVEFTDTLQPEQMATRMCTVHAFVLCSTIENSPSTLSEAMIMGVPSVTSYVGGTPDMACDGKEALFYRDNDPVHLAYQIKRIFDDDALALRLSNNARSRALVAHDPKENVRALQRIYRTITDQPSKTMS